MEKLNQYLEERKIEYYPNQQIKSYVSMGIGGKVKNIIIVHTLPDLKELLFFINTHHYTFILLGGGTNVIFTDADYPLVVIINRTSQMVKLQDTHMVKVNSGVLNKDFLTWAIEHGVGGMDFLAGIPGTIGGAAAVNAGSFGQSISMVLEKAEIFRTGTREIITVDKEYFKFEYRNSIFKYGSDVILDIFLTYTDSDSEKIREKIKEKLRYRKEKHPPQKARTAGCFFKNPIIHNKRISAGQLIEKSGFKGTTYNQLEISDIHANFIINKGSGSFENIVSLEKKIVQTVQEKKEIKLEREVIYISPKGEKY
jgi:UDP-N-acetylmuramate dehydrogenase